MFNGKDKKGHIEKYVCKYIGRKKPGQVTTKIPHYQGGGGGGGN